MVAGPLAGQMLADLGAEVIKIEPVGGDPLRRVGPAHNGMTAMFLANNRHKKSIELDLKTPEGQDIARRIAATADVFIENSRPGVMARLNLSYEDLRTVNPRLVYASVSGFGQTGPYVSRPAFDQVIQAVSGVMEIQGAGGEPQPLNTVLVDKYAGAATASAITAALLHRERTGRGSSSRYPCWTPSLPWPLSTRSATRRSSSLRRLFLASTSTVPSGLRTECCSGTSRRTPRRLACAASSTARICWRIRGSARTGRGP